jgi:DUF4097 and DUF4098 domain-containing protein YvlB
MRRNPWLFLAIVILVVGPALLAAQAADRTRTFNVGAGGSLVVQVTGDVALQTTPGGQVTVEAFRIDEEDLQDLVMEQVGNAVRVYFKPGGGGSDATFRISLPTHFDVDVKTSGGDIGVSGTLVGKLTARTAGGDVKVGDVEGVTSLHTSGGDIAAGRVGGDATLKTSGGDIRLESCDGQVDVSTSGGDIVVGDVQKSLRASTSGGDIRLSQVNGDAVASTAGGDVKVGKVTGSAKLTTAGGDVECQGATGTVEATTAGGDLKLAAISGALTARTAGGDIVADLVPGGKDSSIETAGGDIQISLPANVSARVEAVIHVEGRWSRAKEEYEIRSDFTAASHGADEGAREIRAVYQLGSGGPLIRLETTNGNITINKR